MNVVGTIAAVLVGLVFVVAGASKLAAGQRWPAQARDLGAPGWFATLLPWAELVVGALLVVQLFMPWPAVVAMVMLLGFSTLIALRMQDADRPSCACFGRWSDSEIGFGHLVRNGVFFALAVLALFA